jgi:hypothetical protein
MQRSTEERASLVVARHEPHGSVARPLLERVALGIGLAVRGSVQLEHDVACGNDEGDRRVEGRLQSEIPVSGTFG